MLKKKPDYMRRAQEARETALASEDPNKRTVLLKLAQIWERLGRRMQAVLIAGAPTSTAALCAVWVSCCDQMQWCWLCCHFGMSM